MSRRLYRAGKENRTQNKVEQPNGDYNEIGNRIRKGRKRSDKSTDRDKEFQTNFLLDRINIGIMEELVNNGDIKSSEISEKLKIPLSTIQRRRSNLEKLSVLKKIIQLI